MTTTNSRPGLYAAILAVASGIPAFAGTITDIGVLPGENVSAAYAINGSGVVVGSSGLVSGADFGQEAFRFQSGAITQVPGAPGATTAKATAINNQGDVVGYGFVANAQFYHAFLNNGTTSIDLGQLAPGATAEAEAFGINASNQVAGESLTASGNGHAVMFSHGVVTDLGTLGGSQSEAVAINDLGILVGDSRLAGDVVTDAAEFIPISGLGVARIDLGTLPGFGNSYASAINDFGQVVGWSAPANNDNAEHPFLFGVNGMKDLGLLPGVTGALASAINSSGVVVGSSNIGLAHADPFLWANGSLIDLTAYLPANSGWQLQTADGINDAGLVTGTGLFNGVASAYVLNTSGGITNPTPEPAAFTLLGTGLLLIGFAGKRSRRKNA